MAAPNQQVSRLMAHAIKDADKSFFNENYTKQADATITTLRKAGFVIVPIKPTKPALVAGKGAMQSRRFRPSDVLTMLYQAMVINGAA